jgi:hypothetical protein
VTKEKTVRSKWETDEGEKREKNCFIVSRVDPGSSLLEKLIVAQVIKELTVSVDRKFRYRVQ